MTLGLSASGDSMNVRLPWAYDLNYAPYSSKYLYSNIILLYFVKKWKLPHCHSGIFWRDAVTLRVLFEFFEYVCRFHIRWVDDLKGGHVHKVTRVSGKVHRKCVLERKKAIEQEFMG